MSTGALVAVGSLLVRQLRLLLRGRTHLQALRDRAAAGQQLRSFEQQQLERQQLEQGPIDAGLPVAAVIAPGGSAALSEAAHAGLPADAGQPALCVAEPASALRNVRRVFGAGHPLTWLLPSLHASPSLDSSRAKVH